MFKAQVLQMDRVLSAVKKEISQIGTRLANTLLVEAKKNTPIKQGTARKGWRIERQGTNTRVINRTPYIGSLERGRSKQAPNGILRPTIRGLKNRRKLYE